MLSPGRHSTRDTPLMPGPRIWTQDADKSLRDGACVDNKQY